MKAIIIAGGFGTRLQPLTFSRPKHLLPVANRPFLDYQVALLAEHGADEIVFASNYYSEQIEAHYARNPVPGVGLRFAREEAPLGTAGAIRNAASLLPGERVVVLNGDILTDFDIRALLSLHASRGALATIALREVERPHGFGVLETDADGRVRAWREPSDEEKRRAASAPRSYPPVSDFINAGIYVLEPEAIARIPPERAVSIERETYPLLIAAGEPVYSAAPTGYWMDIGNPGQYRRANAAVVSGAVLTTLAVERIASTADVDRDAEVDQSSVIGPGARVAPQARVADSVILDGVEVGAGASVSACVLDRGCVLEPEVSLAGAVIGEGSRITRGSRIA